jgi:Fic family protein
VVIVATGLLLTRRTNSVSYQWRPIEPLSDRDKSIDLSEVESLKSAWLEVRDSLAELSAVNLRDFNERLARRWSIETGVLEHLYDIDLYDVDRGTTQILIERGFVASLIERSSTNKNPEELVIILRDHKAAVDLIHDCVADSRSLTVGLIHEFHSLLTRHQDTVEALDQFGRLFSVPMTHGVFKTLPNNPKRDDGSIHEYCPPLHVGSEMDNLMGWCDEYVAARVSPILLAAFLHHRFTQIHPYQDGNGRVARLLANLVFVKFLLFPVVITRDDRTRYIEALERADHGDLGPLTRLFADIEKKTILEAISIAPDSKPSTAVLDGVADTIGSKLRRRIEATAQRLRQVNVVAANLQVTALEHMRIVAQSVATRLRETGGVFVGVQVIPGGPENPNNGKPTEHWYHFQVARTAREANQKVNFNEHHYFVRTRLSAEEVPWLTFVISFHHVGQELSGIMEVTAFAEILYPQTEDEASRTEHLVVMDKPFTLTYRDEVTALQNRLLDWANECFTLAVKMWGDVL